MAVLKVETDIITSIVARLSKQMVSKKLTLLFLTVTSYVFEVTLTVCQALFGFKKLGNQECF